MDRTIMKARPARSHSNLRIRTNTFFIIIKCLLHNKEKDTHSLRMLFFYKAVIFVKFFYSRERLAVFADYGAKRKK
jgi:hypothetical protein